MQNRVIPTGMPRYVAALALFLAAGFPVPTANAEPLSWTQVFPSNSPSKRYGHEMAYDSARGRILLFGGDLGCCPDILSRELWSWDGANWTLLANSGPPGWYGLAMAYDSARDVLVVRGGVSAPETWEWDGSTWTRRFSTREPAGRLLPSMAYDSARERVVLFGGQAGGAGGWKFLNDVWEWDGTNWTKRPAPVRPPPRNAQGMAYDVQRERMVMFGGQDPTWRKFNDTWEWEGVSGTWTQQFPTMSPSARELGELVYDSRRSLTLLSGGRPKTNGDAWVWNGSKWTRLLGNGPGGSGFWHAVAYDKARDRFVLFEGEGGAGAGEPGETWVGDVCDTEPDGDSDVSDLRTPSGQGTTAA